MIRIRVLGKAASWVSAADGRVIRTIVEQLTLQARCTLTIAYTYDPTNPIESVRGRYGGGYQVAEWYFPHQHTLCAEQIHILEKVMPILSDEDQRIIRTILEQFSP